MRHVPSISTLAKYLESTEADYEAEEQARTVARCSSLAQTTLWPVVPGTSMQSNNSSAGPRIEFGRPVSQELQRRASPEKTLEGKSHDQDRLSGER
jgi:hypothetical protein